MSVTKETKRTLLLVLVFAMGFGFVESTVVVYLRGLYYPEGFHFPLAIMDRNFITIEVARECATIVMLAAVSLLAAMRGWERFGYFLVIFGLWDLFYYVWLKVLLNWPAALTDWDVLFLIPLPWIGPVVAPVLLSVVMIIAGAMTVLRISSGGRFCFGMPSWVLSILGTILVLYSFLSDTDATLRGGIPANYRYELLALSLIFYIISYALALRIRESDRRSI